MRYMQSLLVNKIKLQIVSYD